MVVTFTQFLHGSSKSLQVRGFTQPSNRLIPHSESSSGKERSPALVREARNLSAIAAVPTLLSEQMVPEMPAASNRA